MEETEKQSPFAKLWAWAGPYHSGFYGAVLLAVLVWLAIWLPIFALRL